LLTVTRSRASQGPATHPRSSTHKGLSRPRQRSTYHPFPPRSPYQRRRTPC